MSQSYLHLLDRYVIVLMQKQQKTDLHASDLKPDSLLWEGGQHVCI